MDQALERLAQSVAGADGLESLARPLLHLLRRLTGLEATYVTRVNQDSGVQQVLFSEDTSELRIPEGLQVPWGDTLCKRALDSGLPGTEDMPGLWGDCETARALGLQSYYSVPIESSDGNLHGTLCAASCRHHAADTQPLDVMQLFSGMLAHQMDREAQAKQAAARADLAEARLAQMTLLADLGNECLRARAIGPMAQRIAARLAERGIWCHRLPFQMVGADVCPLRGTDETFLPLLRRIGTLHRQCQAEGDAMLSIAREDPEVANLRAQLGMDPDGATGLISADHNGQLLAGILVLSEEAIDPASGDGQLLVSCGHFLSLLAGRLHEHTLLETANQELANHAMHDALTGLPNRRYLMETLPQRLAHAERAGEVVHVAYIDLDGFKAINDRHGHETGDLFLVEFAQRVSAALRTSDFVARVGGDEFVALATAGLGDSATAERERLAERLLQATRGLYRLGEFTLSYAGPSIGVASSDRPGEPPEALLRRADTAMYENKQARRSAGSTPPQE